LSLCRGSHCLPASILAGYDQASIRATPFTSSPATSSKLREG
jgi:hypothetical protein